LPVPATADARDIQKAAAEAAEKFRPETEFENSEERKDSETSSTVAVEVEETVMEQREEEEEDTVPEYLRNMVLMSPANYWGSECEYDIADVEFGGDTEVSLWSFSI
jgi:hypothetical protein